MKEERKINSLRDEDMYRDVTNRPHSIRNYDPIEFFVYCIDGDKELIRENYEGAQYTLREVIEDGRFYDMLENAHFFFSYLDDDEKEDWKRENPTLVKWLGVFGFLEVRDTFEKFTSIPSYHEVYRHD